MIPKSLAVGFVRLRYERFLIQLLEKCSEMALTKEVVYLHYKL